MDAGRLTGACHCGAVTVSLPARPAYIAEWNCTLCRKLGVQWGYYAPSQVAIGEAPLASYIRADLSEPRGEIFRCAHCGCIIG